MDSTTASGLKVAAALVFGPTRRSANQSWTQGGGQAYNGTSPHSAEELAGLQPYANADALHEYCQPGDPICAPQSNNTNMANHLNYFDKWGDEAAAWVINLARKADGVNGTVPDQTLGAGGTLKQTIAHPIICVFILVIVLSGLQ